MATGLFIAFFTKQSKCSVKRLISSCATTSLDCFFVRHPRSFLWWCHLPSFSYKQTPSPTALHHDRGPRSSRLCPNQSQLVYKATATASAISAPSRFFACNDTATFNLPAFSLRQELSPSPALIWIKDLKTLLLSTLHCHRQDQSGKKKTITERMKQQQTDGKMQKTNLTNSFGFSATKSCPNRDGLSNVCRVCARKLQGNSRLLED